MSAIPPNIISAIGVPAAQREQARSIESTRQAGFETSRKLTGSPDALVELEVEATDADTQVHADSGGASSQGRYDAKPDGTDEDTNESNGISIDESGRTHIDLAI